MSVKPKLLASSEQLTVVVQGPLKVGFDLGASARVLRKHLPGCELILATQAENLKDYKVPVEFDVVCPVDDPGGLPGLKWEEVCNNANRQIQTTRAGVSAATKMFCLKLRTDSFLASGEIVRFWNDYATLGNREGASGEARIIVGTFFTINPRFDERMAFHVSDWFQFGLASDLRRFWNCPEYGLDVATWYERNEYNNGSKKNELKFRAQYAVEQWLTLNYAFPDGKFPIANHNDISQALVDTFEMHLAKNFIVVHPLDVGFTMTKYWWLMRNEYFNSFNYNFNSWAILAKRFCDLEIQEEGFEIKWSKIDLKRYFLLRAEKVRRSREDGSRHAIA